MFVCEEDHPSASHTRRPVPSVRMQTKLKWLLGGCLVNMDLEPEGESLKEFIIQALGKLCELSWFHS